MHANQDLIFSYLRLDQCATNYERDCICSEILNHPEAEATSYTAHKRLVQLK